MKRGIVGKKNRAINEYGEIDGGNCRGEKGEIDGGNCRGKKGNHEGCPYNGGIIEIVGATLVVALIFGMP